MAAAQRVLMPRTTPSKIAKALKSEYGYRFPQLVIHVALLPKEVSMASPAMIRIALSINPNPRNGMACARATNLRSRYDGSGTSTSCTAAALASTALPFEDDDATRKISVLASGDNFRASSMAGSSETSALWLFPSARVSDRAKSSRAASSFLLSEDKYLFLVEIVFGGLYCRDRRCVFGWHLKWGVENNLLRTSGQRGFLPDSIFGKAD